MLANPAGLGQIVRRANRVAGKLALSRETQLFWMIWLKDHVSDKTSSTLQSRASRTQHLRFFFSLTKNAADLLKVTEWSTS
jgi:hypothetical protein